MNMGTWRRARQTYFNLSPRERVGMTPERLAQIMQERGNG